MNLSHCEKTFSKSWTTKTSTKSNWQELYKLVTLGVQIQKGDIEKMNELITIKELEGKLKVARNTIYTWRKQGLPFKRINRTIRFDYEEVRKWIDERHEKKGLV